MTTTTTALHRFELGRTYTTRSGVNNDWIQSWTVTGRTKSGGAIWLVERDTGKTVRRVVQLDTSTPGIVAEWVMPDGNYTMAPCLVAQP